MLGMRRFAGVVLAAAVLAVLPAPALAAPPRFEYGFGQRCAEDWQLVSYALIFYLQESSGPAKQQLLQELNVDVRRAARECGAP
jgi:hypothetical protein